MDGLESLFDKKRVESINNFIEDKIELLRNIEDFKEKDEKLSHLMSDFEDSLDDELGEKFNQVVTLMYQLEEYYFTLAYLLGNKYSQDLNNI